MLDGGWYGSAGCGLDADGKKKQSEARGRGLAGEPRRWEI